MENVITWQVHCKIVGFPMKPDPVTGKPRWGRTEIRQLRIDGMFCNTNMFRVTVSKRTGEVRYVVSRLSVPKDPVHYPWQKDLPWFEFPEEKWVREGSYDKKEFIAWLTFILGSKYNAIGAFIALKKAVPANTKK